jgi:hypothetical protein
MFVPDRKLKPESVGPDFESSIEEAEGIIASVAKGGSYGQLVEVTLILRQLEEITQKARRGLHLESLHQ